MCVLPGTRVPRWSTRSPSDLSGAALGHGNSSHVSQALNGELQKAAMEKQHFAVEGWLVLTFLLKTHFTLRRLGPCFNCGRAVSLMRRSPHR